MRRIINNIKNHSNWLSYYLFKYFRRKKDGFVFRCYGDLKIAVPQRMLQTYKECFFDETYFKGLPKHIKIRNFRTVVDIGANVGYFSLSVLAKNPIAKVFAYEPIPVNFRLLKQYKDENPIFRLHIFNQAVSRQQETLLLHFDSSDSFTTSASIFKDDHQPDQIKVKATTLEAIIAEHQIKQIDFLKLDCEGAEYGILYNTPTTLLSRISALSIETHPGKSAEEQQDTLIEFLTIHGFQIRTMKHQIWGWRLQAANHSAKHRTI